MFIDGFSISEYRSFGPQVQRLAPLEKINFFIGQNNVGKSNILSFLANFYEPRRNAARKLGVFPEPRELDRYAGSTPTKFVVDYALSPGGITHAAVLDRLGERVGGSSKLRGLVDRILKSDALTQGTDLAWFTYEAERTQNASLSPGLLTAVRGAMPQDSWRDFLYAIEEKRAVRITDPDEILRATLHSLSPVHPARRPVKLVPAIRKIGDPGSEQTPEYGGSGIIDELAQLQNPTLHNLRNKDRFEQINEFLRTVTRSRTAALEIPHDRQAILAHMQLSPSKAKPLAEAEASRVEHQAGPV